jgi:tetratricopeptide (TPR) repeat protein
MSSDVSMAPIYETDMRLHTKIRRQDFGCTSRRFSRWLICAAASTAFLCCFFPAAVTVEAKKKPPRIVKVKIVADQDFARQSAWQRKAAYMLQDISGEAATVMDIRFQIIGYERWRHDPEEDLFRLTARMVQEVPFDSADALIGFTLVPCPDSAAGGQFAGVSISFKGMIIKTYQGRCAGNQMIPFFFMHEIVHLMGGVHVPDGSLMSPLFRDTISVTLDHLNTRILQLTRDVDFKRGYESLLHEQLAELADLYGQAAAGNDATTLVTLGTIFRLLSQPEAATVILREVVRQDSSFTDAWLQLGRCYMQSGHPDSALALLDRASSYADDPGPVYLELARLYLGQGDKDNARRCAGLAKKQGIRIDSALARKLESDSKSE